MRLALAQINSTVGDMPGNADIIARSARDAAARGADLVVFPELALTGYPPKDLLLQEGFIDHVEQAAARLSNELPPDLTVIIGLPRRTGAGLANSLAVLRSRAQIAVYDKRLLPTYDVFDEDRYFVPGHCPVVVDVAGVPVGLSICEDLWRGHDVGFAHRYAAAADPVIELVRAGARVIVNPSASPFRLGIGAAQRALLASHAGGHGVFIAAVNQVGGNDELLFDGSSCVIDPSGTTVAAAPSFEEALTVFDIEPGAASQQAPADPIVSMPPPEALFRALVMGVRDYCRKTGFNSAVLGLSGGIDSALVAVLAAAALGPPRVLGVALPSKYSSDHSLADAAASAAALGIEHRVIPIGPTVYALERTLAPSFAGREPDVTEENIQSRARGVILMALSNKLGHLLLTTGNKSEMAVGYATLYGDMNGGLAVISDVPKTQVYALARWINDNWPRLGLPGLAGPPIPASSISKPPSAELRPGQTDQDSLPPYDVLDAIIERYVDRRQSPQRIIAEMTSPPVAASLVNAGPAVDAATVRRVVRLIDLAEYKRKQAATGLKVSSVAFGSGRRVPIAHKYRPLAP